VSGGDALDFGTSIFAVAATTLSLLYYPIIYQINLFLVYVTDPIYIYTCISYLIRLHFAQLALPKPMKDFGKGAAATTVSYFGI
jgi:hypothetical protein